MPTGTMSITANVGGLAMSASISRIDAGQIGEQVDIAAAKAGTLTVRTNNTDGSLTMGDGHGLAENDIVDIYSADGVTYGATVGVVAGNVVPFTGGAGTNLPSASSAVTVCKQVQLDISFVGTKAVMIAATSTRRGHMHVQQAAGTSIWPKEIAAGEIAEWHSLSGAANPVTGVTVGKVKVSNGDSAGASTFKLGVLYDSTP